MSLRFHDTHIKSLLHFNFPHYGESGDALHDDIGIFSWIRTGSPQLVGSSLPADAVISGTPKFGYRCLHISSSSDMLTGTSSTTLPVCPLEVSCWVRLSATPSGQVRIAELCYKNPSTARTSCYAQILIDSSNKILCVSRAGMSAAASTVSLSLNVWTHVRVQFSQQGIKIFINSKPPHA